MFLSLLKLIPDYSVTGFVESQLWYQTEQSTQDLRQFHFFIAHWSIMGVVLGDLDLMSVMMSKSSIHDLFVSHSAFTGRSYISVQLSLSLVLLYLSVYYLTLLLYSCFGSIL